MLNYSLVTLKSGLPVIRIPIASVKSVTALILTNTGSRYEAEQQQGIAHFFEHLVFKGTKKFPDALSLAAAVDSVGASFNAFTSKEYTGYYMKAASKHFKLALDVISDMLLAPAIRQADIDREKGVIIEEFNMYVDTPSHHIANLFDRMVFQDSGLGHDIIGTKDTIKSLSTADFEAFLGKWYGLGNMVLILAGDEKLVKDEKILEAAEKMFAKESRFAKLNGHKNDPQVNNKVKIDGFLSKSPISNKKFHLEYRQTEQAHFVLGWPSIKRKSKKRYALSLLSVIIGANMSSRLFTEVREKRGLCYYVHSELDQFHDCGIFGASAGVDPKRVDEALAVTINEFKAAASGEKAISDQELQKAKDYLTGRMVLNFEDSESVAQYYGLKYLLMDTIETPQEAIKKLRAVTKKEVEKIAQEIIKDGELRLAIIGPFKVEERFRKLVN